MAKKHKNKNKNKNNITLAQNRDTKRIARRERNRERRAFVPQDDFRRKLPSEDFFGPIRRTVHDEKGNPVNVISRPIIQDREVNNKTDLRISPTRNIFDNIRATVCQKRKVRREVLFATKKTGKGGAKRNHMWSPLSNVICQHR